MGWNFDLRVPCVSKGTAIDPSVALVPALTWSGGGGGGAREGEEEETHQIAQGFVLNCFTHSLLPPANPRVKFHSAQ